MKTYSIKTYMSVFAVLAVLVGFSAVLLNGNSSSKTVKIGVIIPLTGDAAVYGEDIAQAIDMAKEDATNKNVQVLYEDACLATDALRSAQKLILADNVDFITGVFCIPSVNAITPLTRQSKTSVMMTATVPDSIIESKSYVFSPNAAIKDDAFAQAEFAYNKLHARTAAILWMNSDFGNSYSKNFEKHFTELGGEVLLNEPLEFFGSDYRTDISKVKNKNVDLLLAVHFGTQIGTILRQANEMHLNSQIMGTYEAEDTYIIDTARGGAEGLILSSPVGGETGKAYVSFQERYREKYGEYPTVIAAMAYDGFMLQVKAYDACNGEKECIIAHLFNQTNYDGASGKFSISEEGTGKRVFIFKQVRNGKYEIFSG